MPLPPGHRFPMQKYGELRERVTRAPWLAARDEFVLTTLQQKKYSCGRDHGGGCGHEIADTIDIHFQTVATAATIFA